MAFRLGVATLGVAILAYVFGPGNIAVWLMAPAAGLVLLDSLKGENVATDP